jgi:hypothetical protein
MDANKIVFHEPLPSKLQTLIKSQLEENVLDATQGNKP